MHHALTHQSRVTLGSTYEGRYLDISLDGTRTHDSKAAKLTLAMDSTISLTKLAERLGQELLAEIWQAVKQVDADGSPDDMQHDLLKAVQARLAKRHSALVVVQVQRKRQREEDARDSPKKLRVWRPKRPELALQVTQLLKDGVGLVKVPEDKREECTFPMKIFAKSITSALTNSTVSTGCSSSSLGYAVSEVIGAVFTEAEATRLAQTTDARLELHGSTDAAWKGTSARGSGLALNAAGIDIVASAVAHVAERLSQPAMLRV